MKTTMLVLLGVLLGALPWSVRSGEAAKEERVQVCHRPPGNPTNYHTISISKSALPAHLAHGDIAGSCEDEAVCTQLCDDGNKCTSDGAIVNGSCVCSSQPVNCDDTNPCTADSCDPAVGCKNTARVGATCDDGVVCTGPVDTCNSAGECVGPSLPNCCIATSQCNDGDKCTVDTCDLGTHSCRYQAKVCTDPDACTVAVCDPSTGNCTTTARDCSDTNPDTCDTCGVPGGCQHIDTRRCTQTCEANQALCLSACDAALDVCCAACEPDHCDFSISVCGCSGALDDCYGHCNGVADQCESQCCPI